MLWKVIQFVWFFEFIPGKFHFCSVCFVYTLGLLNQGYPLGSQSSLKEWLISFSPKSQVALHIKARCIF